MAQPLMNDLKREFKGYRFSDLGKDMMAGLTVAAVALPLALAFGVSNGADAAAGLITAIISGLVISALAGGYFQISGPTGTMAAILVTVAAIHGMEGVFLTTFLAGVMRLLAGLLRLGKLTAFIPAPVTTGFTSGIAIMIAMGQMDNFFGTTSQGTSTIGKLMSYQSLGFSPNPSAVAMGVFVILFMIFFPKKWGQKVPVSLLSIIIATVVASLMNLEIGVVGAIPKTLLPAHRLELSAFQPHLIISLLPAAFSIAVLGIIESLLCGTSAGRMTGVRFDSNQELIAQGVGNMIIPFFGGIPASAAIARTSMAIKAGARTRLTGVFHAFWLLVSMFVLAPFISQIPLSALAGVLMVTTWRMNEWVSIRFIFSHKFKGAMLEFVATMVATIVFDLTVAILVGVIIGLVFLVTRLSFIEINYEDVDMSRMNVTDATLCARYSNAKVVYITGPMIFANTQAVSDIAFQVAGADTVLFSMRGVSNIDISCAQTLRELIEHLRQNGVDVALCGIPTHTMKMIKRTDLNEVIGAENFYWSVERVLLTNRPRP